MLLLLLPLAVVGLGAWLLWVTMPRTAGTHPQSATIAISDASIPANWLPVLSAAQLIEKLAIAPLLADIRRHAQVESGNYDTYYEPAIERYLEFVQLLPASEAHHHAQPGGMAIHTLEACALALLHRQKLMLPVGVGPEDQAKLRHRWTYGVLAAALLHDVGKALSDLKITGHTHAGDAGQVWNPLSGSLCDLKTAYYHVDFAQPGERDYAAHTRLGLTLMSRCLPREAIQWMSQDATLMTELSRYLSGEASTGPIMELITQADRESVKRNLRDGPRTRFASARTIPLIERLMEALRRMLAEGGVLTLNRNGAAGWVYQGEVFFVAKRLADEVRNYLRANESASGLPGDDKNDRLFDVWQDYGAIVTNPDSGGAVWQVTIEGFEGEPFRIERMSVLRFPLKLLYPSEDQYPRSFIGHIKPYVSAPVKPVSDNVEGSTPPLSAVEANDVFESEPIPKSAIAKPSARPAVPPMGVRKTASSIIDADDEPYPDDEEIEAMLTTATLSMAPLGMLEPVQEPLPQNQAASRKAQSVKPGIASPPAAAALALTLPVSTSTALPAAPVAAAMPLPAPLHPQPSKGEPSELALEILNWLRNGLASGALLHNVKDATVHFVEEGLLLVSPRFFRDFATAQVGGSDEAASSSDPASAITELEKRAQKALVQAGWTLKAANNQNIIAYQIGQSEKTLSGMVIERGFAESRIVVMGYNNVLLRRKEAAAKMPLMQNRSSAATKAIKKPGTKAGAVGDG